jgi:hypothetical protein
MPGARGASRKERMRTIARPGHSHRLHDEAATDSSIARSSASTSSNAIFCDSGIPARRAPISYFAPSVTASVATVRPCHPPVTDTTSSRPVRLRARPRAFSLASAPELQKKERSSPAGMSAAILAASCSRFGCGSTVE